MCLRCGRNSHKRSYCREHIAPCKHCKSWKHATHCCAFIPRATSTTSGETSDATSTSGTSSDRWSQWLHSARFASKQRKKWSKNQDRQKKEHTQQPQAQQNGTSAHTAPPQVDRNPQAPPQGQQQYFYPPPPPSGYMYPPPQQHIPQPSQIIVWQDPDTAAALQQMAQLHQQHFETSQNQTKALKNITSASSFTSTVGCIPIYDGKDKDACTKWLQRCKEASYYTGYNFRSALLQRSSQDVAKVIQSLDEELSHDKLIEEIMCAFSGIPSTAAAIDKLSCICQQPGQNLLIYINKYRDLHWWCTKKLPCEETYKLYTQSVLLLTSRSNRQKTL